jgi:hypothetical protein
LNQGPANHAAVTHVTTRRGRKESELGDGYIFQAAAHLDQLRPQDSFFFPRVHRLLIVWPPPLARRFPLSFTDSQPGKAAARDLRSVFGDGTRGQTKVLPVEAVATRVHCPVRVEPRLKSIIAEPSLVLLILPYSVFFPQAECQTATMNASCQCGAVSFKTPTSKPLALYICHCHDCQRGKSDSCSFYFPLHGCDMLPNCSRDSRCPM